MAIFVNVRKTGDFYRFHKFCLDGVGVTIVLVWMIGKTKAGGQLKTHEYGSVRKYFPTLSSE